MSTQPRIQTSFNAGELSQRMRGRIDQNAYANGLAEMTGYVPAVEGPAIAAPGTCYVEAARGPCRLIPFEFNVTQGYVIEASNFWLRFYTNDARIETSPGIAYELAAPWSHEQLAALYYEQSADVLYMVHGDVAPRKLTRTTATSFALATLDLQKGPFEDGNSDETIDVTPSGVTGSVTLTASTGIFEAGDVGGLFRIEAEDFNAVPAWEPGIEISAGDYRTWGNRVYQAGSGADRTGTVPPIHGSGTEWDGSGSGEDVNGNGPYGVPWTYVHDRYGIVKITGFVSATEVTGTVVRRLPFTTGGTASWRWAFGAFSARRGYPSVVTIWNERLTFAKGSTVYASVVGDYENFAEVNEQGDVSADMALRVTLPNPNFIRWLAADKKLIVGTARAEQTGGPASNASAVGPTNVAIETEATSGSAAIRPVLADGRVLFVQKARRKLLELGYSIETDRFEAPNLTRFARHITQGGIVELAWAKEPERLIWAVKGDGSLISLTYSPKEQVAGWQRRLLAEGLLAKSICTITDPNGEYDQLWIAATLDGAWTVLRMVPLWEEGTAQAEAFFVDAGLSYRGGDPVTTVSGLDHLEGRTVQVLADGTAHPDRVVSGGAITLNDPATIVHAGLGYPAQIRTLPPPEGQGKIKRLPRITLRVAESLGLRVSTVDAPQRTIEHRTEADIMSAPVPLFSGDILIENVGAYERGAQILIERLQPLPSTISAILPDVMASAQ